MARGGSGVRNVERGGVMRRLRLLMRGDWCCWWRKSLFVDVFTHTHTQWLHWLTLRVSKWVSVWTHGAIIDNMVRVGSCCCCCFVVLAKKKIQMLALKSLQNWSFLGAPPTLGQYLAMWGSNVPYCGGRRQELQLLRDHVVRDCCEKNQVVKDHRGRCSSCCEEW